MNSSPRIPGTADSGMIPQAGMSFGYDATLVNSSGTIRSFIGTGRFAAARMTLRKNLASGISDKIPLGISGVDRLILGCADNFAEIGRNFPSAANAAMPTKAGIAAERSSRKRSSSTPKTLLQEVLESKEREAFLKCRKNPNSRSLSPPMILVT